MTLFSIEKLYKNKKDLVISRATFLLPGSQLVMQKILTKATDTQKNQGDFRLQIPKKSKRTMLILP